MSPLDARTDRHGNSRVAPLKALNPDTVYSVNDWIAGLAGGSVGVLGTLIQLELKQVGKRAMLLRVKTDNIGLSLGMNIVLPP